MYPLARDHMAFPELLAQGLEPHKVKEVHMMWWENPEVVVDITDTIDLKLKALACHVSQFKDIAAVEKRVRERGAELGKPPGFAFAETFEPIVMIGDSTPAPSRFSRRSAGRRAAATPTRRTSTSSTSP